MGRAYKPKISAHLDLSPHAEDAEELLQASDAVIGHVQWKDGVHLKRVPAARHRGWQRDHARHAMNRESAVQQYIECSAVVLARRNGDGAIQVEPHRGICVDL